MSRYRLIIKPQSPFQTPLDSDTIFGHVCWALRYLKGEGELVRFLKCYDEEKCPFMLSSGFPKDYLPMPVLRPLSSEEEINLRDIYKQDYQEIEFNREMKKFRKVPYLQISALELLVNNLSIFDLYKEHFYGKILLENPLDEIVKSVEIWHNSKNRLTDMVREGQLFTKQDTFFRKGVEFNVYIYDTFFERKGLNELFDFIAKSGYGADKSVGRGAFNYDLIDNWDLPESDNPNSFMILSNYRPNANDFNEGFYELDTKFGKVGGHWASGIDGGPYKMPIAMLKPGSTFLAENFKPFYGGLIPNVHKQKNIVHYGIGLPIRVRIV